METRWEELVSSNGPLDRQTAPDAFGNPASIFETPLFFTPVSGRTSVREGFGEVLVPLIKSDPFKFELNGAARYPDYSRSGGLWSRKVGGTARLFDSFLIRATRSRDIRAPNITELFSQNTLNIRRVTDRDTSRCVV